MHIGSIYLRLPVFLLVIASCKNNAPSSESIAELDLKRGQLISCGASNKEFGTVQFETSCSNKVKEDFNLAVELLHSFEYDEAEKAFAKVIDKEPNCAMAYWGIAMSNFHPLWAPPTQEELKKGSKAIEIAQSIKDKSEKEAGYVNAIASFYNDWDTVDHKSRTIRFEKAMEGLYKKYPSDAEVAIFYCLSLDAAADPTDKTFTKQREAGAILNALFAKAPNHPGVVHYIIHTYDSPELASMALTAARKYASVAPSSSHALHMPSHIFTRLGLWDECINSNLAAVSSAQCYAQSAGIKGHWDEELHGVDYLMYGYLQKGQNDLAKKELDYLLSIKEVHPASPKVAYSFAAVPTRYALENRNWKDAAALQAPNANLDWKKYPWEESIIHFGRLLGSAHTGNIDAANIELTTLNSLRDKLLQQKDSYKANQVAIQATSGEAWIRFAEGKHDEALKLMMLAADMEDKTEKHPVTPGEVLPARELLGDMYMQLNNFAKALEAYEEDLKRHNNRFNGLYGAALASERSGNVAKASSYYNQLLAIAGTPADRSELLAAKNFLAKK